MKRKIFCIFFVCVYFSAALADIPNPAAAYAVRLGYKYEVRKGSYGAVIFPDGSECGDWAFFRGSCGEKWSYCEQHGGRIQNRAEDMGSWKAEYAVCIFPAGSECDEMDYVDGRCAPGVYKKWSLDEKRRVKWQKPHPQDETDK